MSISLPIHGRGAAHNPPNRFIPLYREAIDGWTEEEDPAPRTRFFRDTTRTIISKNDSPDIPFTYSVNVYRGCEHGCVYCMSGDTPILMGDGSAKPLRDIRTGDSVYGTVREGWYRRYTKTSVLAHWSTTSRAYRIVLEDGTKLIAGPNHRLLTERGWKYVFGAEVGEWQRPFLTVNNKLMGVGKFSNRPVENREYRMGYLCGMIRGDGLLGHYSYPGVRRERDESHQFRLALVDQVPLDRTQAYLQQFGISTNRFLFSKASETRKELRGIRTSVRASVERIEELIRWPEMESADWGIGFLAGLFDAEGSFSDGIIRINNTDLEMMDRAICILNSHGFSASMMRSEKNRKRPIYTTHIRGGLKESLRFLHSTGPCIVRKQNFEGQAVKGSAKLKVTSIEDLGIEIPMFDITTGTGDFIADGVVSHNCYARPHHEYLGLSAGLDFESQIFVKEDAPELLRKELRSKKWIPQTVSMSGVTDCYQPVERRLELTRRCLQVFAEFRNPVGIVTKNALVTRDRDVLAELARFNAAAVYISITSLDPELARAMEPRASAPQARLRAIRELTEAGIPVGVMVAPVVPGLTDHEAPSILEAARDAGAVSAGYVILRLPFAVKDLFANWLHQHYPNRKDKVLGRLREMRDGKLNDPNFGSRMRGEGPWADLFSSMFRLHKKRLGFSDDRAQLTAENFTDGRPKQGELFG